jgi:hypothetical protein
MRRVSLVPRENLPGAKAERQHFALLLPVDEVVATLHRYQLRPAILPLQPDRLPIKFFMPIVKIP